MTNIGDQLYNLLAADLLNRARAQATGAAFEAINLAIGSFEQAVKTRTGQITEAYTRAAQDAQRAMVQAYESRPYRTRFSGDHDGDYRNNDSGNNRRYGGGLLGAALASPEMYHVTEHGIQFINKAHLDKRARQWYRLNFGAGQRGENGPSAPRFQMKIFGESLPGDLGLFGFESSEAFRIPRGFWSDDYPPTAGSAVRFNAGHRGEDAFILGKPRTFEKGTRATRGKGRLVEQGLGSAVGKLMGGNKMTLGIRGSRFLDAGVGTLVHEFPRAIEELVSGWLAEASRPQGRASSGRFLTKGPVVKIEVHPSKQAIAQVSEFLNRIRSTR